MLYRHVSFVLGFLKDHFYFTLLSGFAFVHIHFVRRSGQSARIPSLLLPCGAQGLGNRCPCPLSHLAYPRFYATVTVLIALTFNVTRGTLITETILTKSWNKKACYHRVIKRVTLRSQSKPWRVCHSPVALLGRGCRLWRTDPRAVCDGKRSKGATASTLTLCLERLLVSSDVTLGRHF